MESMTALVRRQVMAPTPPHRPLLPHVLIQPLGKQTRDILGTEALVALRQTVLMTRRLNSTTASKVQPRHRPVIPSAQGIAGVFPTPTYASKEME
jgi:hypothetical protein